MNEYYLMGERDKAITEIQIKLRKISEFDTDIPTILEDGIYGSDTSAAVAAFQSKYGLISTGEVDFKTFSELDRRYSEIEYQTNSVGSSINFSELEGNVISIGEVSKNVFVLKLLSSKISELDASFSIEINEEFDSETEYHVKRLQGVFGYEPDGRVDLALWKDLTEFSARKMY